MFLTVHATAGIIIGQHTNNIGLAFLGGVILHFLLDIIPHGDEIIASSSKKPTETDARRMAKIGLIDLLIMTSLLFILYQNKIIDLSPSVIAGVVGSIIPDFVIGFYLIYRYSWLEKYLSFHQRLHNLLIKLAIPPITGMAIQAIVLVASLTIIKLSVS